MRGVVGVILAVFTVLVLNANASGFYTGSDGKTLAVDKMPEVKANSGTAKAQELEKLCAFFFKGAEIESRGKNRIAAYAEFEDIVRSVSGLGSSREIAQTAADKADELGYDWVGTGQKDGYYCCVAIVEYNGKARAAVIVCDPDVTLSSLLTGPEGTIQGIKI